MVWWRRHFRREPADVYFGFYAVELDFIFPESNQYLSSRGGERVTGGIKRHGVWTIDSIAVCRSDISLTFSNDMLSRTQRAA